MFRAVLLTTALVAPGQLFAQSVSERADQLTAEIQKFLPRGSVRVVLGPLVGEYKLSVSADSLARLLAAKGITLDVTPFRATLTEQADGLFTIRYDQPLSAKVSYGSEFQAELSVGRIAGTGEFDPALGAFRRHDAAYTDMRYVQSSGPGGELGEVTYMVKEITARSEATANPVAGIDATATYTGTGLSEDLALPGLAGDGPLEVTLTAATFEGSAQITGARSLALLDLIEFGLANYPPDAGMPDQQRALKAHIRAAAPFFDSLSVTSGISDLTAVTSLGTFAAAGAAFRAELNGAVSDGKFSEHFAFEGVTLPAGLLPDWAEALMPDNSNLGFELTGFDPAAVLAIFLDRVDFRSGPDRAAEDALAKAVMPTGKVAMTFSLGADASGNYVLESGGDFLISPSTVPTGSARVSLAGIDAILAEVNKAPPEIKQGAIPGIAMIRGLGKLEGEATVWDIQIPGNGSVLVNGNDISPFLR